MACSTNLVLSESATLPKIATRRPTGGPCCAHGDALASGATLYTGSAKGARRPCDYRLPVFRPGASENCAIVHRAGVIGPEVPMDSKLQANSSTSPCDPHERPEEPFASIAISRLRTPAEVILHDPDVVAATFGAHGSHRQGVEHDRMKVGCISAWVPASSLRLPPCSVLSLQHSWPSSRA
jgi:hypothetical protein